MTKELEVKRLNFDAAEVFFPHFGDVSHLLVSCAPADYSASAIAHAVEAADARLLNMNLTSLGADTSRLVVHLRVNHRDPERVARSLERFGFEVVDTDAPEAEDSVLRRNYDHLMHLLNL